MSMTTMRISIKELLEFGWLKTKQHYWYLFCVGILAILVKGASMVTGPFQIIVSVAISISLTYVLLIIARGETPTFESLTVPFRSYKTPLTFFLATLLIMIAGLIGLALLILPGIWILIRLQFYKYIVLEHEGIKARESLAQSFEMTKGHFWQLFLFLIVIVLFNFIGILCLFVGLLITLPVTGIAYTHLYMKLKAHHHASKVSEGNHEHAHHVHA